MTAAARGSSHNPGGNEFGEVVVVSAELYWTTKRDPLGAFEAASKVEVVGSADEAD